MADALSAHERALSIGGGLRGVPNLGLVESAIGRPYSGYYPKIAEKAAALVQSMANNRGFADGNKRTTLILLHTFLTKSDYVLCSIDAQEDINAAIEELILATAVGRLTLANIAAWLTARVRRPRRP